MNSKIVLLSLTTVGLLNCIDDTQQGEQENIDTREHINTSSEYHLITFDQFMGTNAFVDDPVDKMQAVGFIREYHNWSWDEGNGNADYRQYPNNAIKWAPSEVGGGIWNFDRYYQEVKNAGLTISPCIQGTVRWLDQDGDFNASNRPVDKKGLAPDDPHSYHKKAHFMYQFAARYGATKVADDKLTLAEGQPIRSGMGLVSYLEDWNEQDKGWEGPNAYFSPQAYAAMLSANYDGHANSMKSGSGTFGIKNADPQMRVVMGGLADPSLAYIKGMKSWFEANRPDKKFAADVINVHYYTWKDGKGWQGGGPALGPEEGGLKELMQEIVEYRDQHLPELEVWISEFGWDTNPQSPLRTPTVGPFDTFEVQAQWLVRAYLAFAAAGVDRAQMFMLRDVDPNDPTWFASCGLVTAKGDWSPKTSWYYVHTLKNTLKNMRYIGEQESADPNLMIYKFKDVASDRGVYVVWAKTKQNYTVENFALTLGAKATTATLIQLVAGDKNGKSTAMAIADQKVNLTISERPVFLAVDNITAQESEN